MRRKGRRTSVLNDQMKKGRSEGLTRLTRINKKHVVSKSASPPTRLERKRELINFVFARIITTFWYHLNIRSALIGFRNIVYLALYYNYAYKPTIAMWEGDKKAVPSVIHHHFDSLSCLNVLVCRFVERYNQRHRRRRVFRGGVKKVPSVVGASRH